MRKGFLLLGFLLLLLLPFCCVYAGDTVPSIPLLITNQIKGSTEYSLSIKIIAVMAVLTVLPALLVTFSAFTRIIIVFSILRQGLGIPNVPNNQVLIGLSLIMTVYVMMPIIDNINQTAVQPYLSNKINEQQAFTTGSTTLKTFLLKQTRKADLNLFTELSHSNLAKGADYPLYIVMPAFITSELKTAFEIGFLILLPFLVIDLVVASILMSMGMMMLSPIVISLPFKILFFILIDGWTILVTSLINSFRM
jgi:flagellar biosynthesis protein FliP